MTSARSWKISVVASLVVLAGCRDQARPSSGSTPSAAAASIPLDAGSLLRHKMECRTLGVQAEKEQFPEGKNTTKSLNQGLMYFDSVFGYDEKLNTCLMLSGFQLTDLKTMKVTSFQATLTDLLSNKMLETYLVLGDQLAPASVSRSAFVGHARELCARHAIVITCSTAS